MPSRSPPTLQRIRVGATVIGRRRELKLVAGTGMSLTGLDIPASDRVEVTIDGVQDGDLAALAALGGTGHATRTGAETWALRSIAVGSASLTVANPAGIAGNPTLDTAQNIQTSANPTFAGTIENGNLLVEPVGPAAGDDSYELQLNCRTSAGKRRSRLLNVGDVGTDTYRLQILADDGSVNTTFELTAGGSNVYNESGLDIDFRWEGDNDPQLLFLDAGNDRVGIGTTAPAEMLEVERAGQVGVRWHWPGTIESKIVQASDCLRVNNSNSNADIGAAANVGGLSIPPGGKVGIGVRAPITRLEVLDDDGVANGLTDGLTVTHRTTGTPANGLAAGIVLRAEDAAGNLETIGRLRGTMLDVTNGSEDTSLALEVRSAGAAPTGRVVVDGLNSTVDINDFLRLAVGGGINVEVLAGTKTLTRADSHFQRLDPGGAGREVRLPPEAAGLWLWIANWADAAETLDVREDAGAVTIAALNQGEAALFACSSTTWYHLGVVTIALS